MVKLTPMGSHGYKYRYVYDTSALKRLPSYWSLKYYHWSDIEEIWYHSSRNPELIEIVKEEGLDKLIKIRRQKKGYTYQYNGYCKLYIDPKNAEIYTTEKELERIMREEGVTREQAVLMCNYQAGAYLTLLQRLKLIPKLRRIPIEKLPVPAWER